MKVEAIGHERKRLTGTEATQEGEGHRQGLFHTRETRDELRDTNTQVVTHTRREIDLRKKDDPNLLIPLSKLL